MIFLTLVLLLTSGCAASAYNIGSVVLPTSGRKIDMVQSRSDISSCAELVVLSTYNDKGELLDSKAAHGNAIHCQILTGSIQAGAILGGAAILRPDRTTINNNNEQGQFQNQSQIQTQLQNQVLQGPIPDFD